MPHARSVLAVAAIAATAIAQTVVLPTSAAALAGISSNGFPFGISSVLTGLRVMCLYDSSHFTAAPVPITSPVLITALEWRANDEPATTAWIGGTFHDVTVRLGTAAVDYSAASMNWASNVGPDFTVVYSGPVAVAAGTGAGFLVPGPYHITIPLSSPFLYDPNAGDLVVDTDHNPGNFTGGSIPVMDVEISNASRVWGGGSYPAANGVDWNCPVIRVAYTASSGTPASNLVLGQGCILANDSFYEYFGSALGFDLDHTVLTMIPTGPGRYTVRNSIGSLLPVGSISTPVSLTLGNDSEVTQTFTTGSFPGATSFNICSNGFVSIGSNGTAFIPNATAFLNATNTSWRSWHDFNPTLPGSGQVKYEESAAGIVVTWDGVKDSAGIASTMQMQFYPTGQVTIAWGTMSHNANSYLVGYSPGGPSINPGSTNLSALGAGVITLGTDRPLALTAATRPILGASWNLTTSQIPATGAIGLDIFGLSDPNIPDLVFIGAPTCGLRSSLDVLSAYVVTGASHNHGLPIPSHPTLIGFQLFTTGAVMQIPPVNALGWITANGIKGTVGDV